MTKRRWISMKMLRQSAFSRNLNHALITPEYIQNTVIEYRAICEAISARDAEQARAAMQANLTCSH
ncbi:FCD domain-containing protein [Ochrobactrum sp. EDr1-4]|uniref:FCD domain-containing protein n=1 Tax=Ochrobactrum sp. EDr1-4 TaxID=3368622 RepID=UPI003BA1AA23